MLILGPEWRDPFELVLARHLKMIKVTFILVGAIFAKFTNFRMLIDAVCVGATGEKLADC
jgi:hypothetical protein